MTSPKIVGSWRTGSRLLAFLLGLMLTAVLVWGQAETGQITGTVLDQTGAAMPQADVTAKNLANGATRSTVTNSSGTYVIPNLPPGTYEISITASGFSTYKQTVTVYNDPSITDFS